MFINEFEFELLYSGIKFIIPCRPIEFELVLLRKFFEKLIWKKCDKHQALLY